MAQSAVFPVDGLIRANFTSSSTTDEYGAANGLGPTGRCETNLGPAIWAKAAAAISANDLVDLSISSATLVAQSTTTARVSTTPDLKLAVAIYSLAINEFGWFLIGPFDQFPVNIVTGVSANVQLTTTVTAGAAGTGGTSVVGLVSLAANSSGSVAATNSRAGQAIGTTM